MAYKDLQVHVDNSPNCDKRLHVAATMAAEFGAHLTGIFVRSPFHLPSYIASTTATTSFLGDTEWLSSIANNYENMMDNRESEAKQLFDKITSQYQAECIWESVKGDVYSSLIEEAGYADLLVLGQADPDDETNRNLDVPDHILLATGRPCLVVPYIGADKFVGKHPLIAWNGSRESNRALHDALPLLERAETVTVMMSEGSGKHDDDLPDTRIAQHLARHDVKVMTKTTQSADMAISNDFLSYLADNGHDLLIMGAYGHSKFREAVFGGMTRDIMHSMTVPVLMSH